MTGKPSDYPLTGRMPPPFRPNGRDRYGVIAAAAGSAVLVSLFVLAWMGSGLGRALFDGTHFSLIGWEVRSVPNKWLYKLGEPFHSEVRDDEALRGYFTVVRGIEELENQSPDELSAPEAARLDQLRDKRRRLENQVEAIIEGRITSVVKGEGLTHSVLGHSVVWPPVDFELTAAPRVLGVSPRDRIQLLSSDLLSNALSTDEAVKEESKATGKDRVAVLLETSGVAAYPSIVADSDSYRALVETATHEWLHQYLFFYPLGQHYFTDLRAANETIVTIAAGALMELIVARFPFGEEPAQSAAVAPPAVDTRTVLSNLRREVDALLAAGQVDDAERRMEETRLQLEAQGVRIRKINQAYFAFRGLYATSGASGDDLGERVQTLHRRLGSVGAFLRTVRDVSNKQELDEVLRSQS